MHRNAVPLLKPSSLLNEYNSEMRGILGIFYVCVYTLYYEKSECHHFTPLTKKNGKCRRQYTSCVGTVQQTFNVVQTDKTERGGDRRGGRGTFKFQRGFQNSFPSPPSQQCVGENHSFCLIVKGAVSTPAARSNVAILSVLYSRRTD